MTAPGIVSTRAILLRAHDYSETSRVLRYFTEDHGIVGVMARGIRRRSAKGGASSGLFDEVMLTLQVKPGRDLQTLRESSSLRSRPGLGRNPLALSAAGVLGEIVLRHHGEAGSPEIYDHLGRALDRLGETPAERVPAVLLAEGWGLVTHLGFQPELFRCVRCGRSLEPPYGGADDPATADLVEPEPAEARDERDRAAPMGRLDFDAGGMRCPECAVGFAGPRVGPRARAQLAQLLQGTLPDRLDRPMSHLRLFSDFVTVHVVGGRPLESFRVFSALLPPSEARA